MSIKIIENLARSMSADRNWLADRVNAYNEELEQLQHKHMAGIRRAAAALKKSQALLHAAVDEHPELFEKPRSMILHGIKVGYQKAKGAIRWDDGDKVVALIRKHFPDQAEILVKVEESPVKTALAQLPAADLKRLGVEVKDAGDEVVVKPVDGDVEKLVAALLKDKAAPAEEVA